MDDNRLDKLFKAEKENEGLVPPASVWEDLENDLGQNKRKKRIFVWWILGVLLIATSIYYIYQSSNISTEAHSKNSAILSDENNGSMAEPQDQDNESDIDKDIHQNINLEEKAIKNDNDLENEDSNGIRTTNSFVSESERNAHAKNLTSTLLQKKNANTNREFNLNNEVISIEESIKNSLNQLDKANPISHDNKNVLRGRILKDSENKNLILPTSKTIINIPSIRNLSFLLKSPPMIFRKPKMSLIFPNINKKNKVNHPHTFAAFIHLGRPNFKTVVMDNSSHPSESDWYSIGVGISYQYEISHGLHLGGGLNLRQSKKKFNFESEELSLIGYKPDGTSTTPPFEYGKRISQGEQKYSLIDLAASIKYDIWSRRMKVSVGLSTLLNIKLITEGKALDESKGIIRYSTADKAYQSALGFGISPSITFSFPMNDNTFLTFIPNFTTYFENLQNELLERDLKYSNFGIDIGVSKRF